MAKRKPPTLPYGPVYVTAGPHKGRIGFYDAEDDESHKIEHGIVYFADFGISPYYYSIRLSFLVEPTTDALMRRREELHGILTSYRDDYLEGKDRVPYLEELHLVEGVLAERMFTARLTASSTGAQIFLSYSSRDKQFVRWLAVDLRNLGHRVWLDEWEILVGESIPRRIAHGLDQSDFVAVVLSKHAVESHWVENEWQAKYWEEIERKRVLVLPILKDDCRVPTLLRAKKYADFRHDYADGFEALGVSLTRLRGKTVSAKANQSLNRTVSFPRIS
jgi:hypothetical protein